MKFEKWQALGNDYVIVERRELPFDLTAARIRALCATHTGVGSDGVLLLSEPEREGVVAALRIFNPDGSEAELSGNGAREAVLYLRRRGHVESDEFAIDTAAGEIRPRVTSATTCTLDMGRASVTSRDFPSGAESGRGELEAGGRTFAFQHVSIGNPQCAIEVEEGVEELDLAQVGPPIEGAGVFPNRTNVSFWRREGGSRIRARIFERGVGETLSSGTGASGAAVAAVLRGVESPVSVRLDGGELEVEVDADLRVRLTGWAVPVYAGSLSADFVEALREAQ